MCYALSTVNLSVGYRRSALISDININIKSGETALLIGANGAGKSTLLRTLFGAQNPLKGDVIIENRSIFSLNPGDIARNIAIVLPGRSASPALTVNEFVAIGRHPYTSVFGQLSDSDKQIIDEAIRLVGLSHKNSTYLSRLSDGEYQKAAIARAIAQQTPIIILDEPTSFLDISSRFEILNLLNFLSHSQKKAVILSTHDVSSALPFASVIWAIVDHSVRAGSLSRLNNEGILNKIYPGIAFNFDLKDFFSVK